MNIAVVLMSMLSGILAGIACIRLFAVTGNDAEIIKNGDYSEYLKAWEMEDSEESREAFTAMCSI